MTWAGGLNCQINILYLERNGFLNVEKEYSIPTCRRFSTHLQQTTFDNNMANGEIAHNEQFLHLPQCFQLYLITISFFVEIFPYFCLAIFKVFCCRFPVLGKGSKRFNPI